MQTHISYLFVYYSIYLANSIGLLSIKNLLIKKWSTLDEMLVVLNFLFLSGIVSIFYSFHPIILFVNLILNVLLLFVLKIFFKEYSYSGLNFYLGTFLMAIVGIIWGINFLQTIHVSLLTRILLLSTSPLLLLTLPSDTIQLFEQYDVLCRTNWKRPRNPRQTRGEMPMVSLHVPTYSEPPEMVIETLNILSNLNYENYEVIVIDNNTQDSALWMPVKEHCDKLGEKFKFLHVSKLAGAKGGALNFAGKHTNPKATLVSVIDADYHADSNFLKDLVGHFEDPKIGFVQTPHDYRNWENNLYMKMCYWEYKIFFHTTLVSLNERDATLTVGTMCIVNRNALNKAGGWSEWCVTEDSELAIRIHDAGFSSVYVDKTYGKGLIPETFSRYKKQRRRWTAGPIQELQYHFKHYVGMSKKSSAFTFLQRIHHFNHGLDNFVIGFTVPLNLISIAVVVSMILNHEIIQVPFELWLAATVMLIANFLLDWLIYRVLFNTSIKEILWKNFAHKALKHTVTFSAFTTAFTGNAIWNRTSKFKSRNSFLAAVLSAKEELVIGILILIFIVVAYKLLPYTGLVLMFLIGLFYTCMSYLSAPLLSIINVWSMRKEDDSELLKLTKSFNIPYLSPSLNNSFHINSWKSEV